MTPARRRPPPATTPPPRTPRAPSAGWTRRPGVPSALPPLAAWPGRSRRPTARPTAEMRMFSGFTSPCTMPGQVSRLERTGHLDGQGHHRRRRQRPAAAQVLGQRLPAELANQHRMAFRGEERPVQRDHVRVLAEQGERLQLLVERFEGWFRGVAKAKAPSTPPAWTCPAPPPCKRWQRRRWRWRRRWHTRGRTRSVPAAGVPCGTSPAALFAPRRSRRSVSRPCAPASADRSSIEPYDRVDMMHLRDVRLYWPVDPSLPKPVPPDLSLPHCLLRHWPPVIAPASLALPE